MTTTGLQYKNREARFAAGLSYKRAVGRGEAHYETADGPLQMPDMRGLYRSMDSRRIEHSGFRVGVKLQAAYRSRCSSARKLSSRL